MGKPTTEAPAAQAAIEIPQSAPAETALAEIVRAEIIPGQHTAFAGRDAFELAQRMARCLAESDLVPQQYRGNLPNCILALEMSQRMGANPLMVMQNLNLIRGKPSWAAVFVIAGVNTCGRFSALRYALSGKEGADERACIAYATDIASGERLDGPAVSLAMAKAEGWYNREGSKWRTMPEVMLRYRAATFFSRLYAPELTMGMRTADELEDIEPADPKPSKLAAGSHSYAKPKPTAPTIDATPSPAADPEPPETPEPSTPEPSEKPAKPAGKVKRQAGMF